MFDPLDGLRHTQSKEAKPLRSYTVVTLCDGTPLETTILLCNDEQAALRLAAAQLVDEQTAEVWDGLNLVGRVHAALE